MGESLSTTLTSSVDLRAKMIYFVAGALLPTLAYIFMGRQQKFQGRSMGDDDDEEEDDECEDEDDSSEESLTEALGPASSDCKSWGIRDAPYKVRIFYFEKQLIEPITHYIINLI